MTEAARRYDAEPLARIDEVFHHCFRRSEGVCLEGGYREPVYRPGSPAVIGYRADFVNSMLHEIAHWCVAGAVRRRQPDYGYWYAADSRDLQAQRRFECVEQRPQALECLFAIACALPFRVSVDNIAMPDYDAFGFRLSVWQCLQRLQRGDIGARAERFVVALAAEFGSAADWRRWRVELADVRG